MHDFFYFFRQLSWHTLKIESKSTDSQMTPIRLITNQSCCRMTVKKKLSGKTYFYSGPYIEFGI